MTPAAPSSLTCVVHRCSSVCTEWSGGAGGGLPPAAPELEEPMVMSEAAGGGL